MTTPDWTPDQRRAAAADLCERAARMLRSGGAVDEEVSVILDSAAELVENRHEDSETDYRTGLANAEVSSVAADAAVTAILAAQHPPDSLAGRLADYYRKAHNDRATSSTAVFACRCAGEINAIERVAEWIGCLPSSPTPKDHTP